MNQIEILKIIKENNLKLGYDIQFPRYRILPDEVKLALSVLQTHGMKVLITIESLEENEKP